MFPLQTQLPSNPARFKHKLAFFSLQGLGDSILDFPIFLNLRQFHDVEVVTFNNGSSAFYRAYHDRVTEVASVNQLMAAAWGTKVDSSFVCFPSWRREIAASLLVRAPRKFMMRPIERRWLKYFYADQPLATPMAHHLEENILLLSQALGGQKPLLDIRAAVGIEGATTSQRRVLAIHPTASTPFKFYPRQFWIDLLAILQDDFEDIEMFCGRAANEIAFCKSIIEESDAFARHQTKLYPGLEFGALTRRLGQASCFVGSDSSLMHLSALLDVPLVALWSFANHRVMYPYGNSSSVYIPKETLSSRTHEYPRNELPYMKRTSAADVARIVRRQLPIDFTIRPKFKNTVNFHIY